MFVIYHNELPKDMDTEFTCTTLFNFFNIFLTYNIVKTMVSNIAIEALCWLSFYLAINYLMIYNLPDSSYYHLSTMYITISGLIIINIIRYDNLTIQFIIFELLIITYSFYLIKQYIHMLQNE